PHPLTLRACSCPWCRLVWPGACWTHLPGDSCDAIHSSILPLLFTDRRVGLPAGCRNALEDAIACEWKRKHPEKPNDAGKFQLMKVLLPCRRLLPWEVFVCVALMSGHLLNTVRTLAVEQAIPQVLLVLEKRAPPLERQAADELKAMLERLFVVQVRISDQIEKASTVLVVGRPQTNKALVQLVGENWPKLSDQGLLLRRLKGEQPALVLGG